MAKVDLTKAAERFLSAMRRVEAGLTLQRQRVLDRSAKAPRLPFAGLAPEVILLLDDPGIDLDYYVYELGRLRHAAEAVIKVWGRGTQVPPQSVVDALAAFDVAIPKLKDIRDPITHPNNDARLSQVAWFSSIVTLHPGGRVEYLVDPDSHQHDAALALTRAVAAHCQGVITDAIAAEPPKPIDQQIVERKSASARSLATDHL